MGNAIVENIAALRQSSNAEIAGELLELDGCRAVDIGCGEGAFTRYLAERGAIVTGIDSNESRIAAARAAAQAAQSTADFQVGNGEALPFADGALDLVVFSNSLHHVPVESMDRALAEGARVLRAGGRLYAMEPIAQGPYFEVQRLWNDETKVRALALAALGRLGALGLVPETELVYGSLRRFADYDAYEAHMRGRGVDLGRDGAAIRRAFMAHARRDDDGFALPMAFRVNLFRKGTPEPASGA